MIQVALSLTLLVVASLFGRTLRNLQNIDLGFQRENIAIFDIDPTSLGYRGQGLRTFYDQLLERARIVPGVRSAALSGMTPMSNYTMGFSLGDPGVADPNQVVFMNPVSPQYFTTLGIPLLAGRDFRPEDEPREPPSDSGEFFRSGGSLADGLKDPGSASWMKRWHANGLGLPIPLAATSAMGGVPPAPANRVSKLWAW